ncbi:hypothetical protein, partial [Thiomicrospira sp. WB1]|uniref:hypothetical protein n=1 Tax=Thiomicrospira sp. WB1 TaxID=1685380 RepID=UPI00074A715D
LAVSLKKLRILVRSLIAVKLFFEVFLMFLCQPDVSLKHSIQLRSSLQSKSRSPYGNAASATLNRGRILATLV